MQIVPHQMNYNLVLLGEIGLMTLKMELFFLQIIIQVYVMEQIIDLYLVFTNT